MVAVYWGWWREIPQTWAVQPRQIPSNDLFPNHPVLSTVAGLLGSLAGDRVPTGVAGTVKGAANVASRVAGTDNAVNNAAKANLMANATAATGNDVVSAIDANMPNWQFLDQNGNPIGAQPKPTLGDVTQDRGINNLIYNDQAAAARLVTRLIRPTPKPPMRHNAKR